MKRILFYSAVALLFGFQAQAFEPVVTDSRIKTLVYNENDVYRLVTHYGYQSNIEFSTRENIEAISLGDRIGWQIVPAGRRLFIRPLAENAHTNMTVITNRRAYQFDLYSGSGDLKPAEDLAYVVRFYYPEDDRSAPPPIAAPVSAAQLSQAVPATQQPQPMIDRLNFRYTFTGPETLAPLKVFDDGQSTYFRLRKEAVITVSKDGRESPVRPTMTSDGFLKVPVISGKFTLHYGSEIVCVYNEAS